MRCLFSTIIAILVVTTAGINSLAGEPLTEMVKPPTLPPNVPNLDVKVNRADTAHAASFIVNSLISAHRVESETKEAVERALIEADSILKQTGAPGVLLEAQYHRAKNAELFSELQPPNTTEHLVGDKLQLVKPGRNPVEARAMAMNENSYRVGYDWNTRELVPGASKAFWVTRKSDGTLAVEEISHSKLERDARQVFLDEKLLASMHREAYSQAVGSAIQAVEVSAPGEALRTKARELRMARDKASDELRRIDADLGRELDKAKKANADAEVFAITSALAGTASSVASSLSEKNTAKMEMSTSQKVTPLSNGNVQQLIERRISINGQLMQNERQIGNFLRENGRIIYVPQPSQ